MKKWKLCILIGLISAGSAFAVWPFGSKDNTDEEAAIEQPAPQQRPMRQQGGMRGRGQVDEEQRGKMNEERRAKMQKIKAEREALHNLAESARNEEDPVKKAELVNELRAEVTANAEKMQAEFGKRLAKAEAGVAKMKERLAEAESKKAERIEQHVQDLLAGKKPARPDGLKGKRPEGGRRGKGPQPPVE